MNNRFVQFISQRWFLSLLGVVALTVLVWFVGPLIAIAETKPLAADWARLIVIVFMWLIWGIRNLYAAQKVKSSNAALTEALTSTAESESANSDTDSNEGAVLQSRFTEALEILKRASVSGKQSKRYLYELPWYILIGPPGSGKTTALMNSGLEFPLEAQFGKGALKGVGGTRHCDWWFTDKSVIIDTAGRYTTQDSHASQDSAAWKTFVALLKKYRPRRPINGAVIALSMTDILYQTEAELDATIRAIRARLQELTEQLGVKFPVYLVFTKCDLVDGFNAYFSTLSKEERAQVWGATMPEHLPEGEHYAPWFAKEFDALAARIQERLFSTVHFERDPGRRGDILSFPMQFGALKADVVEFISKAFSDSRYHDQFLLRGVYFTSGTQDTNSIDRVMHQYAGQLGIQGDSLLKTPTHSRSFFIRDLLQQVIFSESELVGSNRLWEARMRWLQSGVLGLCVAALCAAGLAWATSFSHNQTQINTAEKLYAAQLEQLNAAASNAMPLGVLPALQSATKLEQLYAHADWRYGFGLNLENTLLRAAQANKAMLMREHFLPSVKRMLEHELVENADNPEYLHQTLKAYLMLEDAQHFDAEFEQQWLAALWNNQLLERPAEKQQLNHYWELLLAQHFQFLTIDAEKVEQSRRILRAVPLHKQIYGIIKQRAKEKYADSYRFDREIGNEVYYVFENANYEIPRLFTLHGYNDVYKPARDESIIELMDDNWVVGTRDGELTDLDLATVQALLDKHYLEDYIGHWEAALNQIKMKSTGTLGDHVNQLSEMLSGHSPLRALLEEVSLNTQPSVALVSIGEVKDKLQSSQELAYAASNKVGKLARLAALVSRNKLVNLPENPVTLVDKRFAELNKVTYRDKNRPSRFDGLLASLVDLQLYLDGMEGNGSRQFAAYEAAVARMSNNSKDPLGQMRVEARHYPEPLKRWLSDLVGEAWQHVLNNARAYVSREYSLSVRPFYEASLAGRYPFESGSDVELTLSDFQAFFKPQGIEDQFFKTYLKPFVDTSHKTWRLRQLDGRTLGISSYHLSQFQKADTIRRIFFAESDEPLLAFSIKPVYLDANVSRFELDMLGEQAIYRHGPQQRTRVVWPNQNNENGIKYKFEDYFGAQVSDSSQGVWSLFRFINKHKLTRSNQGDRYNMTVEKEGKKAVYELAASRAINPFSKNYLGEFELPSSL